VVHPDQREEVQQKWKVAVASGTTFRSEYQLRGKDATYRWFKAHALPIRGPDGRVVKWYGTSTDVDDLKQAEEERGKASGRLASVIEGIDDGFVALDQDLTVTHLNSAAERAFGRTRGDLEGKSFFESLPEARGTELDQKLQRALRDRVPLKFETQFDHTAQRGLYTLRVYPHPAGVSIFFQHGKETRSEAP